MSIRFAKKIPTQWMFLRRQLVNLCPKQKTKTISISFPATATSSEHRDPTAERRLRSREKGSRTSVQEWMLHPQEHRGSKRAAGRPGEESWDHLPHVPTHTEHNSDQNSNWNHFLFLIFLINGIFLKFLLQKDFFFSFYGLTYSIWKFLVLVSNLSCCHTWIKLHLPR